MALALNNLRQGKKYKLINHSEVFEFVVIEILDGEVFKLKDIHTLDSYYLHELTQYGKGKDYDLMEL